MARKTKLSQVHETYLREMGSDYANIAGTMILLIRMCEKTPAQRQHIRRNLLTLLAAASIVTKGKPAYKRGYTLRRLRALDDLSVAIHNARTPVDTILGMLDAVVDEYAYNVTGVTKCIPR